MKYLYSILIIVGATLSTSSAQPIALKTNLLYGAATLTPNLGLEIGLGKRTTLEFAGGYNPWHLNQHEKKIIHWMGQAEFRYWFCERFNGVFIGAHALGSQFNIAGHKMPLLLPQDSQNFRYEGEAYGGGVSVGYQFILARRWNLELNLGVGYARVNYRKFDCAPCGTAIESGSRNYFGPTRAGVSIVFLIGRDKAAAASSKSLFESNPTQ